MGDARPPFPLAATIGVVAECSSSGLRRGYRGLRVASGDDVGGWGTAFAVTRLQDIFTGVDDARRKFLTQ
ncbi:hypothetical protein AO269_29685 [Pseudomonas putida]|nr:hypothetical protein AO269_29685 [Pseudomonas putida]